MRRLSHIDWLRGLAVVIMIEAHTIDSWTVDDPLVRGRAVFHWLQFLAGWAAPSFLFLAGVSVVLSAAARMRKGKSLEDAAWDVMKRGWEVVLIAYLFRVQSFMLTPTTPWRGLLKVDILNVMGVAMVLTAWCWARGRTFAERTWWLLTPAALCVLLSQYSDGWHWPIALFGTQLSAYVRPFPLAGNFSVLPWGAFVFAGAWFGELLNRPRPVESERAFYSRLGLVGLLIVLLATAGSYLPTFTPYSNYWTSSTSFFLMRIGVLAFAIYAAWLWMRRPTASHWSPMLLFGRTSLFVYWVHVEIVYGFLSFPLHHELSIRDALVAYVVFTLLMLAAAILWDRRSKAPLVPERLRVRSPESGVRGPECRSWTPNPEPRTPDSEPRTPNSALASSASAPR